MARDARPPSKLTPVPASAGSLSLPLACESCKYWHRIGTKNVGECWRYPPIGPLTPHGVTETTITAADYGCGEFRAMS